MLPPEKEQRTGNSVLPASDPALQAPTDGIERRWKRKERPSALGGFQRRWELTLPPPLPWLNMYHHRIYPPGRGTPWGEERQPGLARRARRPMQNARNDITFVSNGCIPPLRFHLRKREAHRHEQVVHPRGAASGARPRPSNGGRCVHLPRCASAAWRPRDAVL